LPAKNHFIKNFRTDNFRENSNSTCRLKCLKIKQNGSIQNQKV